MTLLGKLIVLGLVIVFMIIIVPLFIKPTPAGKIKDPHKIGDVDSQFIDLNGVTLHYKKVGNGEPTLILLHGFGSSLFTWNKVLYPLSPTVYSNCLRLDRFRADYTANAGNLGRRQSIQYSRAGEDLIGLWMHWRLRRQF